jgi:neurotransmitter:Na+ symporter, NSS family
MSSENGKRLRPAWGTRMGFIFAAAGSAVGLGNIWKFPYITGENGGGLFVLIYLACVVLVGLPIMISEIMIGHRSQQSPVGAFEFFRRKGSRWGIIGWLGVLAGFVILSYYSVVAGWSLNYIVMALGDKFNGLDSTAIGSIFDELYTSGSRNLFWHTLFMSTVVVIVVGGVRKGIEKTCNLLMPLLLMIVFGIMIYSVFLPNDGFLKALDFIFYPHVEKLTHRGVLEALGHSFFTLSLGMGAMITYGSYLSDRKEILSSSILISLLDTVIALMACMMIYPVVFAFGQEAGAGPGLVFKTLPLVFSQLPGGFILSLLFFMLLAFAALSSAISLQEVVTSTVIDKLGWTRKKATLITASLIFVFGIPSALAGGGGLFSGWADLFGMNFFDSMDFLASNWLLPLGGLLIALFVGWAISDSQRREAFGADLHPEWKYKAFRILVKYVAPALVMIVFMHKIGFLQAIGLLAD